MLADNPARALELVQRVRAAGLGSVVVLVDRDPRELVAELAVVPIEELLASAVPAVTAEGIGWDPVRGELWFAGETAEAVLLELEARRRALAVEVEELATRAEERRADGHRGGNGSASGRGGHGRRPACTPIPPCFGGSRPAPTGSSPP